MTGHEIVEKKQSILNVALKYGYDSAEGFTKAFTRFHRITPSEVRKNQSNLKAFQRISLIHNLTGGKVIMGDLGKRGYIVKETGAVYYSMDLDRTLQWFTNILVWYGQIDARDDENQGTYGCVNNIPIEIESLHLAPFTGVHLFKGEPSKRTVGFMMVQGVDQLYTYVKNHGWNDITEVESQPWGGKTCSVTTIDGSVLTFFEIQ